mgnify:FL=1
MHRLPKVECHRSGRCDSRTQGIQFPGWFSYQIQMHLDDQEKTAFVKECGVFFIIVMTFGLKISPTTFQRIIMEIFGDYILAFMHIFLNEFVVYNQKTEHLYHLRMCLEKCQTARLSLNTAKCAFLVTNGVLMGHIVG